ncbi:MAG: Nif3-like dinuclear metal center hexameric protein [Planctomycetota bacterium]
MAAPSFAEVVDILHEIAPLELAAEWDNVGVLLQPHRRARPVARVLLAIDLTEAVVAEAIATRADLVVAYHPPIFQGLKSLSAADSRQRSLLRLATAGVAVHSPHTALDAAPGGLADWLVERLLGGEAPEEVRPCGDGEFGRVATAATFIPFRSLVQRCKRTFGVRWLQVARPARAAARVRTIAVAAGAGGAVLRGVAADVFVTGELSHHDTLAAVAAGASVVLAGHANTERGFLPVLRARLLRAFGKDLAVRVARSDRDPLAVV